jgi:RNA polymerase sigma-70 factor (ECF subfamily)
MQVAIAGIWPKSPPPWPEARQQSVRSGAVMGDAVMGDIMHDDDEAVIGQNPAGWITAIAACQDRAAFAALFAFYAPRIKTMLMQTGASADTGEDIAQETLLTVWRKAAYYDADRASASAWVYTIARNIRIDRLRQDKRAKLYALAEPAEFEEPERPDAVLNAMERAERIRAALSQIPEEQVRVLQLSFFEGQAHGDIAEKLNLPLGTVKSRLRLAMSRLRHLLGDLQ